MNNLKTYGMTPTIVILYVSIVRRVFGWLSKTYRENAPPSVRILSLPSCTRTARLSYHSPRNVRRFIAGIILVATSGTAIAVDYADLYEKNSDSVVTVKTRTLSIGKRGILVTPGVGTGFLIDSDVVMTAAHVVDGVDMVRVRFKDDSYVNAHVIASEAKNDVALLKLKSPRENAVIARLGNSDQIKTGSPVFIIGAPYGIEQTLSVGILSGRMQRGKAANGSPVEFLQTDTAINPGNSGGPMFNTQGEVIGVVSFILSKSGGFDGIGFASAVTPAHNALKASSEYIAGFKGHKLTARQKRALSIPSEGVLIQRVVTGSIAAELGLKAGTIPARIADKDLLLGGDVVLGIECDSCEQKMAVAYVADKFSAEQSLTVKVFRNGQLVTLKKAAPIYAQFKATPY